MRKILIDTSVIIDLLRGRGPAHDWISETLQSGSALLYSSLAVAELAAGLRPGEEPLLSAFLSLLTCIPADEQLAWAAGTYLREYGRSHGLDVPDAIIAASAKKEGAALATLNVKHFPMKDLVVIRPY